MLQLIDQTAQQILDTLANTYPWAKETVANVQKGFTSMDSDGEKLALLCQEAIGSCNAEQGKRLLQSLSFSLEKML